jgi:hypothetical protein
MSSIDDRNEARAARFFDEVIVPLSREVEQPAQVLADVAPRRSAASYYTPVAPFAKVDFEAGAGAQGDALVEALVKVWADRPFLHALARHLAELGATLEPPPPQTADVSPFVYVMF